VTTNPEVDWVLCHREQVGKAVSVARTALPLSFDEIGIG